MRSPCGRRRPAATLRRWGQRYVLHVSGNKIPAGTGLRPLSSTGSTRPFRSAISRSPACCSRLPTSTVTAEPSSPWPSSGKARRCPSRSIGSSSTPLDRFALVRIGVAAPGDLWKSEFDLVPGPAAFAWGGSTGERHTVSCDDQEGKRVLVVTTSLPSEQMPGAYDVHQTVLRPRHDELIVVRTNDQMISEIQPPCQPSSATRRSTGPASQRNGVGSIRGILG